MTDLIDVSDEAVEAAARAIINYGGERVDRYGLAERAVAAAFPVLRAQIAAETREKVDTWLRAYAYSSEDIVLGDAGLTARQLPDLHALLDSLSPDWRTRLARTETNG